MSLRTTVSGSTPGLIQIGTMILVRYKDSWEQRVVTALPDEVGGGLLWASWFGRNSDEFKPAEVRVDLYDSKTSRVHAAWWLGKFINSSLSDDDFAELCHLCGKATGGQDMTPEEIDAMVNWINWLSAS